MIPISLEVNLEFNRTLYAKWMDWDMAMYDTETKSFAHARCSTLAEDLGQIEYILTDKTGTLHLPPTLTLTLTPTPPLTPTLTLTPTPTLTLTRTPTPNPNARRVAPTCQPERGGRRSRRSRGSALGGGCGCRRVGRPSRHARCGPAPG